MAYGGLNITFPGNLAQVDGAADLRLVPSSTVLTGMLFVVKAAQGVFAYDPASLDVDDGMTIIKPADKTTLQAGRWVKDFSGLAAGPTGPAGPALGAGLLTAAMVSNDATEQTAIAVKLTTDQLIKTFGAGNVGATGGVAYGLDARNNRFFLTAYDTAPLNDTNGYFAGVVSFLGRQPMPTDIGLNSAVFGRNCYVVAPGSVGLAGGHDCLNVATAAVVWGAGCVIGNQTDITGNLTTKSAYCSILVGKNSELYGQTAACFGESNKAHARGAFVAGFQAVVESTATLAPIAMGPYVTVKGGGGSTDLPTNGAQFAIGAMIMNNGQGKMSLGSGINPGAVFTNDIPGSLQIGSKGFRGSIVCTAGVVGESYAGRFYSRVGFRALGDGASGSNGIDGLGGATNEEFGGWMHQLDGNTGGDTTTATIETRTLGTVAPVLKIRNDYFRPATDNVVALGGSSNRFTTVYAATGTISTSDESAKRDVGAIPDEWLDAWGEVQWSRYRFKDAFAKKGDEARWHVGLVAQKVRDAFEAHGVDATAIGLLCFDEWPDEHEEVLKPHDVTTTAEDGEAHTHEAMVPTGKTRIVRKAGSRWGLRYDECFALEAAWQRRELARLHDLLAARSAAD